ncbi:MAG: tRNA 2-thiouridine(34) synthase MnmA [Bacteroidota bacterium]|jgi:tRNA-specific 2-thiouridylase
MKRVVVGLSGGVDSAVTAALLVQQGYEVIGVFMRNWHDESVVINNECPWITDSNDALAVAEHLGIPFHVLDLSEAYRERIVEYMFNEYENGRTPNPDVLCNREIKFDVFLKAAMQLKADFVATGHYCQKQEIVVNSQVEYQLLMGEDSNKDQSYFLCQLNQSQLEKALFPIGHLTKPQVRALAEQFQLPNAEKKDSQGLCFIGKVKLPTFLQQQLQSKKGKVIKLSDSGSWSEIKVEGDDRLKLCQGKIFVESDGVCIGEHTGAHFFTVGQRKGLGIGGQNIPLFVVGTDTKDNVVYVAAGEHHLALAREGLLIKRNDLHWIRPRLFEGKTELKVSCRIRYRQPLFQATITCDEHYAYVIFDNTQFGVAKGQFAAFYLQNELIGSGVIYE